MHWLEEILYMTFWYSPHFTPKVSQQKLRLKHSVSRAARQLTIILISFHTEDVTSEKLWSFEFWVKSAGGAPIYVINGFLQRIHFNQQHQNVDTSYEPTVVKVHCFKVMKNI